MMQKKNLKIEEKLDFFCPLVSFVPAFLLLFVLLLILLLIIKSSNWRLKWALTLKLKNIQNINKY